jgi:hypothetical protein
MKLRLTLIVTVASAAVLAAGCGGNNPEPTNAGNALGSGVGQPTPTNAPTPPVTTHSPEPDPLHARFGQPYKLHYIDTYNPDMTPVFAGYTVAVTPPVVITGLLGTPHGQYISFTVTIKATSEGISTNPMYFYVRDSAGVHHNGGSTGEETLQSTTMHAGETLSGTIIADVPALRGTLALDPPRAGSGGSLVEWPFLI